MLFNDAGCMDACHVKDWHEKHPEIVFISKTKENKRTCDVLFYVGGDRKDVRETKHRM